jgi:UDPglucose 6-dehydrogenase
MNIGIVGVGRLGIAYALVLEQQGFNVFASSYKSEYIELLSQKKIDSNEPGISEMLASSNNIHFTIDNHKIIDSCDIIYVMVATPSTTSGDYDVSAVHDVANDFLTYPGDVKNKILIVGSTVNPGTCAELQILLDTVGVHVVYCPTFVAQGSVLKDIADPHTLSLGTDNTEVADRCKEVFSKLVTADTPIYQMHSTTAEILKLAGNCRATMEISYFNLVGQILIKSGVSPADIDVANQYLNFVKKGQKWKFGFGFGGPCYPRDNNAFVHYADTVGINFSIGKTVDQFNESHVEFLTSHFLSNNPESLPYYFDYVSYKKGVNIFEESHQLKVCKKLLEAGATVYIEPSVYLLQIIIDDLQKQFTNNVKFVSLPDLDNQGIKVYRINI